MSGVAIIIWVVAILWLTALTYVVIGLRREQQVFLISLKRVVGAEKHVGGTGRNRRRTDFRVPVNLSGFLRVLEHARPCRIVDLSRSGAQVLPDGGEFPVGETGVLTVDFGEFESANSHVKIVRIIEAAGSYGVQFVDQPESFRDKCANTMRAKFREQLTN